MSTIKISKSQWEKISKDTRWTKSSTLCKECGSPILPHEKKCQFCEKKKQTEIAKKIPSTEKLPPQQHKMDTKKVLDFPAMRSSSNSKITLSKAQWQFIGKKAGWMPIDPLEFTDSEEEATN